jgi:ATP-dependent Lon protease
MHASTTSILPVLPLTAGVVLPGMVVTVALETDDARAAADAAEGPDTLLLVPRIEGRYARVGVIGRIEDRGHLAGGTPALVIRAERRARVGAGVVGTGSALWVQAEPVDDEVTGDLDESTRELRATMQALLERVGGTRLVAALAELDTSGALADSAGWWPDLSTERKVELLETLDVGERVARVQGWAEEALAELELRDRIRTRVTEDLDRRQRELLLRQQLEAIRAELGEDGAADAVEGYRTLLAELDAPQAVRDAVAHEIGRLARTSEQSAEHGWLRAWLDRVLALPWGVRTDDDGDLDHVRAVLDADHTGLDEVKQRILEDLAVRTLRLRRPADAGSATTGRTPTILALVGPPGVGKTSLGASVARALGRRFVRVALGGVRDEAEIRGHRRTYVGAQEGRIARALAEAGTMNPVVLLDELDKVGADWRGDPSAALLEVLDPAQNHTFRDHFLELELDLSDVLFIATANVAEAVPPALLDRLEVLRVEGYTDAEKVAIAREHLLPRLRERSGLAAHELGVTDAAVATLIADYTDEAGVRGLERHLATLVRRAAVRVVAGADDVTVDAADLRPALGRPRTRRAEPNTEPAAGVVNGLAVTGAGGEVLIVEATAMDGDDELVLTGQLGDVMTESGAIALSHLRSRRDELGISAEAFRRRLHVHFPAGAVPKDGPSAGIAMTTALASLLTGRPVRPEVAMTGEVTLQGKVLPIGGVRQKLLAAHRAGLREVVLPIRNEADLDDVPADVRAELTIHLASTVAEVLDVALAPAA